MHLCDQIMKQSKYLYRNRQLTLIRLIDCMCVYMLLFQKFGIAKIFYVFNRSLLCSPRLHLFDKNTKKHYKKYYDNLK